MRKLLKLAIAFSLPLAAMAEIQKTNPVTGETETYDNVFTGAGETATEWNSTDNWTLNEVGKVPFVSSGNYDSALVDGKTATTDTQIDGWTLRVGAYNGASITWNGGLNKIQSGGTTAWLTADKDSSITIGTFGGGHLDGSASAPLKLYSARAGGITWSEGLSKDGGTQTLPFYYYLTGEGSVVYNGALSVAASQVIKQADVTLSGNEKSVQSKKLISFASSTATFTADAAIKIKDGDDVLKTVYLTSVTAGATTLTTEADVGTCELVQTSTGVVLYYVDGDPADVPVEEKTYKPSININFTNGAANGLTTGADVGLSGYEVPGTSWNNYVVANSTFSTVNAIDSTGAASAMSGVSVTISNVSGSWSCSGLTASSDFRQSYIDESAAYSTPTVTVSGIPYYKYRVLVYHSTDTANVPFGYDTINGTNYTYVEDALSEGSTAWGNSGPQNGANAIAEGGNVLVTEALSGSTLTVVGHRAGGANNARGCIAAIQIIEVKADVGENDLEIPVSGDTQYTVEETKELSGTVYLTGLGTLTLAGENKISAATIEISEGVTLVVNADRLDATTFTGAGTVVYDGSQPDTTKGFDNSAWTGTVWVKNIGSSAGLVNLGGVTSGVASANPVNSWGNENSFVKFTNVYGFMYAASCPWTLILEDEGDNKAWYNNNGWSANDVTFARIMGSGTFYDAGNKKCRQNLVFTDATAFAGSIRVEGKRVGLGGKATVTGDSESLAGVIEVVSGATATLASGKTWYAGYRIAVNGTLTDNGILDGGNTSAAISGTGTVVFGGVPSPTGDAWWKNAAWTGTVQIDNITDMIGRTSGYTGTYLDFNSYGNANSLVKLGNLTGWMDNYTCNVPVNLAGTLTINNGVSGEVFTFKKLISSGGYITATDQSATFSIRIEDGSEYAGYIGLNSKRVIFGTGTAPAFVKGQIYVSSDATITVPSVNTAYWSIGGILVDGELKADNLARFGGGTNITTGDDGVFTLTSTGNGSEGETDTDYARIKGTGSLKYDGTGWRALSTNNFPTAVTLVNEQVGDILLSRALTYTVGSLSGSKNFQGNYGSGNRYLNVIQSKDTEWSGKVVDDGYSRFAGLKLDASSTGTLTLSGTASQNVALEVNGGAVNLTGTWKGATTVAGTFGGTGTLTGNLTFSDGATLKANASALTVSGTVTIPVGEGESLTIDATGLDADEVTILSSESITTETDVSKVTVDGLYTVEAVAGALKLVSTKVAVTIPAIANATVSVTADGVAVTPENGVVTVDIGAAVVVTYTAVEGYQLTGDAISFTASASTTTVDVSSISVAAIVANVTSADGQTTTPYTSAASAIAEADDGETVTLLEATVTLTEVVAINKSITILSGNASGTTIKGKDLSAYPTLGAADLTLGANVTVSAQLRVLSGEAAITHPTGSAPSYRPPDGYMSSSKNNGDDTTTITFYQQVYVYATGTNATLADENGNQLGSFTPVASGDTFVFTVTPAAGCALVRVTADGVELTPSEGKYSISIGSSNVSIYAVAGAAVVTGGASNDEYCSSLQAAVDAATSGQTVTLLADVTLNSTLTLPAGKTLTMDLGGFTIYSGNDSSKRIVVNGTVTMTNGVVDGQTTVYDPNNGTAMIRVNGSLTLGANLTIRNTINAVAAFGTGSLTVNGATINALGFAISTNGSATGANASNGTVLAINSGTITSTDVAVYLPSGTMTINGGTITGSTGVYAKGGSLSVPSTSTAVITGNGANAGWSFNGNGANSTGDALVIDNSAYPYGPATATIAGGTYESTNGDAIGNYTKDAETLPTATGFVSGGTFSNAVAEEFCAEGFEPKDNDNGTYGVREDKGWIYEAADAPNYTGSWNKEISYDETTHKAAIEDGATYTASKPSAGQLVTIDLELSFDAANSDDDVPGGAKAAVRLGEGDTEGTYVFQLYTTNETGTAAWLDATASGVTPTVDQDYAFKFVLDMTNRTYTVTVDNVPLTVDGAETLGFASANASDTVRSIEFTGSGKVTSITGSYEDPEGFVADETIGDVTLTAAQAEWLNGQGNYDALAAKLATMTQTGLNDAYLLNLNVLDTNSKYTFAVKGIVVGEDKVDVTVTLTREGALMESEKAKPIVGTLKLKGTAALGTEFTELATAAVEFDADAKFGDGATETTVTVDTTKTGAKFYLPVIE